MDTTNVHTLPEFQKYACLVMDRVKVKEDLKNNVGLPTYITLMIYYLSWNERGLQPPLATNMLVFMVWGVFLNLEYPINTVSMNILA